MNQRDVLVIDLVGQLEEILGADLSRHGYGVIVRNGMQGTAALLDEGKWHAVIVNLDLASLGQVRETMDLFRITAPLYMLTISQGLEFSTPAQRGPAENGESDPTLEAILQNVLIYHRLTHVSHMMDYPWETMLEATPDMIALLDLHMSIIRCNRHFCDLFGRDRDTLAGHDLRALFRPIGEWCDRISDGSTADEHVQFELHDENLHKDFQMTVAALRHEDGARWGYVLFAQDMTERKLIQKQLLHSQKMESVGTLAAGVAHEINNPVGFIHSNLNSLRRYMAKFQEYVEQLQTFAGRAPQLEPEELATESRRMSELRTGAKIDFLMEDVRQLVDESQDGTERIRRIVNNLKGFARNEDTRACAANLNERLDGVLNLTWNEIKYKAAVNKDYGELPPVQCFAADLDQVFVNLLINAVQAISDKGEITIRTWLEGETACVSIHDTGAGIPEHVLPHIFEPFYTTKPVGKGTGLGLSISYDIVNKHGGDIKVRTRSDEGTTFTIMLPLSAPGVRETARPAAV